MMPMCPDRCRCRKCERVRFKEYGKTPHGKAARAWGSLCQRAGNKTGRTPAYLLVEVRMTRVEFMAWAVPAFTRWMKRNPGGVPSVDRRDNSGHYEIGNVRIITKKANRLRSTRYKNLNGCPRGKAWCGVGKHYELRKHFNSSSRTINGLQTQCRECHRKYVLAYRRAKRKE